MKIDYKEGDEIVCLYEDKLVQGKTGIVDCVVDGLIHIKFGKNIFCMEPRHVTPKLRKPTTKG